jgi:DNA polymerase III alpha subunit
MKYDPYGQLHCITDDLCDLLYKNPDLDLSNFQVDDPQQYNKSVKLLYATFPKLKGYYPTDWKDTEDFDKHQQSKWHMPEDYKNLDIAEYILKLCKTDAELQRVGQELLLYQERDLFDLLKFLKYLIDTLRKNNIVWGVGRGSSVASYVLYLLGVHKIDSLYYDLDIGEFLK